jgi:hypothetical protein
MLWGVPRHTLKEGVKELLEEERKVEVVDI